MRKHNAFPSLELGSGTQPGMTDGDLQTIIPTQRKPALHKPSFQRKRKLASHKPSFPRRRESSTSPRFSFALCATGIASVRCRWHLANGSMAGFEEPNAANIR